MSPGCSNIQLKASSVSDTIDSFEVLEQTVIKQKKLARKKKSDLRLRILLKRTFDLVCEIMDRENGFDDDYLNESTCNLNDNNICSNYSDSIMNNINPSTIPLPPTPPPQIKALNVPTPPPPPPSSPQIKTLESPIPPPPLVQIPSPPPLPVVDKVTVNHVNKKVVKTINCENQKCLKRKATDRDDFKYINNKKFKLIDMNANNELKETRILLCV